MVASDALFELINALDTVSTTLTDMTRVLEAQREAVGANDLSRLLAVTNEQEELTARLERCERRRLNAQGRIERELGVSGVREIAAALPATDQFSARLMALTDEIGPKVQALQDQSQRASQLLKASIDHARRTRSFLLRVAGTEPTYAAPLLTR